MVRQNGYGDFGSVWVELSKIAWRNYDGWHGIAEMVCEVIKWRFKGTLFVLGVVSRRGCFDVE